MIFGENARIFLEGGAIPKTSLHIFCHILGFKKVLKKFQYNFPNSGGDHPNLEDFQKFI